MSLGKMLRAARGETKLTQAAQAGGVDHSTLWKWEAGERTPKHDDLSRYLEALGVEGEAQAPFFAAAGVPAHVLVGHGDGLAEPPEAA